MNIQEILKFENDLLSGLVNQIIMKKVGLGTCLLFGQQGDKRSEGEREESAEGKKDVDLDDDLERKCGQ